MLAPAVPSRVCLTLGASLFPAYLDLKARCTPEELPTDYYGDIVPSGGSEEKVNPADEDEEPEAPPGEEA